MRILILGGYGHFGGRIARTLAADGEAGILVAGRDLDRARAFVAASPVGAVAMHPQRLDIDAPGFASALAATGADLLIHAAGPFQGRDYAVARAALACGMHYVDLADGRAFVAGFDALDAQARRAQRLAITGASSVPGLSAAAVAAYLPRFSRLDAVEAAISPGNRTPRGLATTRAILGYVGQAYRILLDGQWRTVHGWQSLRRERFSDGSARWLARCEVPDLDVLPRRHPSLRTCDFRAGLELRRMHFGLWLASWAVRGGLLRSIAPWAGPLLRLSERWLDAGSDTGAMLVRMRGIGLDGAPLALRWELLLPDGDGPQVPCTAAIVLARKLMRGELAGVGAGACVDLFTLDEYLAALEGYQVRTALFEEP